MIQKPATHPSSICILCDHSFRLGMTHQTLLKRQIFWRYWLREIENTCIPKNIQIQNEKQTNKHITKTILCKEAYFQGVVYSQLLLACDPLLIQYSTTDSPHPSPTSTRSQKSGLIMMIPYKFNLDRKVDLANR